MEASFNVSDLPSQNLIAVVGLGGLSYLHSDVQTSNYLGGGSSGAGTCSGGLGSSGGGAGTALSGGVNGAPNGVAGSGLTGGVGGSANQCGGGGGAGYFGGGGGGSSGSYYDAPGGGGSGYASILASIIYEEVSTDLLAPNATDPDYPGSPIAEGGNIDSNGGSGYIVLIWE